MSAPPSAPPPVLTRAAAAAAPIVLSALVLAGCGSTPDQPADTVVAPSAPSAPSSSGAPAPDPAVARYCETVVRVQQEQTSPQAGQGGVAAASEVARRQVADLAAAAPPEIAPDWQQLSSLTDQALASLAATGGDPNRIDRGALTRLEQESQPAVERIKQVTAQRCNIAFRPPA